MKSNLIPSQKIRVGIIGLSADGGWGALASVGCVALPRTV